MQDNPYEMDQLPNYNAVSNFIFYDLSRSLSRGAMLYYANVSSLLSDTMLNFRRLHELQQYLASLQMI
jgi:hypothetical protein